MMTLTQEKHDKLPESVKFTIYWCKVRANQICFIPTGFYTWERAMDSPLHYGVRKSVLFKTDKPMYETAVEALKVDGKVVGKMKEVLACFPKNESDDEDDGDN